MKRTDKFGYVGLLMTLIGSAIAVICLWLMVFFPIIEYIMWRFLFLGTLVANVGIILLLIYVVFLFKEDKEDKEDKGNEGDEE